MSIEVVMPQMGESLSEGTVTKWLKKVGERVERDEPLFEISTDKVDTEIPAPTSGVLERILVPEGSTVAVETVVAVIGTAGAERQRNDTGTGEEAPAAGNQQKEAPAGGGGHFQSAHQPITFTRRETPGREAPRPPSPPSRGAGPREEHAAATEGTDRRHVLSPAVLSLAARENLPMSELTAIPGTGRGGRITKKDVVRYLERSNQAPPVPPAAPSGMPGYVWPYPFPLYSGFTPPAAAQPPEAPTPPRTRPPAPPAAPGRAMITRPREEAFLAETEVPSAYLYRPEPEDTIVPMSSMRKQIAEHMLWSQRISAQVTSFTECDMHRIARYREEHREDFEAAEGIPLTFLPFVAEATVRALKDYPLFNASVLGDRIVMKKHVHLGIAVALEEGLIVPVVRNADEMNFVGLARSIQSMAERARSQRLAVEDVQGATFTVTNPGMFGGLTGTPMIPQPQMAILGLGAIQKKPVVVEDAIAIRPIMVLALTFDHRIIDGATGFQFLERIRSNLEHFDLPA